MRRKSTKKLPIQLSQTQLVQFNQRKEMVISKTQAITNKLKCMRKAIVSLIRDQLQQGLQSSLSKQQVT